MLIDAARQVARDRAQWRSEQARRDQLTARLKSIRLLVFDFDGVWTTNQVIVMQDGTEAVLCNRSDGLGLGMLRDSGLDMCVLTAEVNPVTLRRCEKLKIECTQVVKHKLPALQEILGKRGVDPKLAAYVGNDVNDLPCMKHVGVSIAVADALPPVKAAADAVTTHRGGLGAVREVTDWFLEARTGRATYA